MIQYFETYQDITTFYTQGPTFSFVSQEHRLLENQAPIPVQVEVTMLLKALLKAICLLT